MTLPATIEPCVDQALIQRATRLFNGTLLDIINELQQNSRRAGATLITIDTRITDDGIDLVFSDDGSGIGDPAALLALGASGWNAQIAAREDPAGMGVFSLAGRQVTVRSFSAEAGKGWSVTIPATAWHGGQRLPIVADDIDHGTHFAIRLLHAEVDKVEQMVRVAARYFPLPVRFRGTEVACEDFLAGAHRIVPHDGCRIGIFKGNGDDRVLDPRINFHGVTVPCSMPSVGEQDSFHRWTVKIDIIDAPTLQLVLPARKEMVENVALAELRDTAAREIFCTIADEPSHRLAFDDWQKAISLCVDLPEAAPWLERWRPMTADSNGREFGEPVSGVPMILVSHHDADIEQGAGQILSQALFEGATPVCGKTAFAGYQWYDALPRIDGIEFTITIGETIHRYGEVDTLPDVASGKVDAIHAELTVLPCASQSEDGRNLTLPVPMLACKNDGYSLDEALILIDRHAEVSPDDLAWLIEQSLFCSSDDSDCDSWDTQHRYFEGRARDLANELLLGEEAALLARLRDAAYDNLLWLVPKDRSLTLTGTRDGFELSLSKAA